MRSGIGDQSRSELERILLEGPRIKDLSAVVRGRERCSVAITNILGALTVHAPTGQARSGGDPLLRSSYHWSA